MDELKVQMMFNRSGEVEPGVAFGLEDATLIFEISS